MQDIYSINIFNFYYVSCMRDSSKKRRRNEEQEGEEEEGEEEERKAVKLSMHS